jgi:hypothetical protein
LGVTAGAAGGGTIGAAGFGRAIDAAGDGAGLAGATFTGAAFLGAAFFGVAFFLAAAFFGAAFLAFLATLDLAAFFAGRAFLFAALLLFLAAARLAFAGGRFFPLAFFFAMVSLLLGSIRHEGSRCSESSPEKVRCHLRSTLESARSIAYAATVMPNDPIRPLHDVWLRPRRVFRELGAEPVGRMDLLLSAAQGIVGFLVYCRMLNAGATYGLAPIFGASALAGALFGIAGLYVMGAIYSRLAAGMGRPGARRQILHVLAYGGVPVAASLGIWVLTALIAGNAAFLAAPRPEDEGFVAILLNATSISYLLLSLWSIVLQFMGFSEVLKVTVGKAALLWILGRLVGFLAALCLKIIATALIPGS